MCIILCTEWLRGPPSRVERNSNRLVYNSRQQWHFYKLATLYFSHLNACIKIDFYWSDASPGIDYLKWVENWEKQCCQSPKIVTEPEHLKLVQNQYLWDDEKAPISRRFQLKLRGFGVQVFGSYANWKLGGSTKTRSRSLCFIGWYRRVSFFLQCSSPWYRVLVHNKLSRCVRACSSFVGVIYKSRQHAGEGTRFFGFFNVLSIFAQCCCIYDCRSLFTFISGVDKGSIPWRNF